MRMMIISLRNLNGAKDFHALVLKSVYSLSSHRIRSINSKRTFLTLRLTTKQGNCLSNGALTGPKRLTITMMLLVETGGTM